MIQRSGILVIAQVATGALRVQPNESSLCGPNVARFALQRRVGAEQRKAIPVFAKRLNRTRPSQDGVAGLAAVSKLLAMDIGVAVGTVASHVSKFKRHMAARAGDIRMQASQRKPRCGVVVELRDRANRLPADGGMAILAGNVDGAVRVTRPRGLIGLGKYRTAEK
jgi:hypothetical protein